MDLHVFMPNNEHKDGTNDVYGSGRRVGWNKRKDVASGGSQDVDYTDAAPVGYIPVENITFPSLSKMPEGKYVCKIHNWSFRSSGGRGKAEIEFDGQVFQYEYPKTKHKEWITVAEVTLKDGVFTIEHKLPESTSSKTKWGLQTNQFIKVKQIMLSPNHWNGAISNKHYIFALENAVSDESPRPFFNEFLNEELMTSANKRMFEVLGGKIKVENSTPQVSGLGFSDTQRNSMIVRVTGTFSRNLRINF
jgi:hypothetical protein